MMEPWFGSAAKPTPATRYDNDSPPATLQYDPSGAPAGVPEGQEPQHAGIYGEAHVYIDVADDGDGDSAPDDDALDRGDTDSTDLGAVTGWDSTGPDGGDGAAGPQPDVADERAAPHNRAPVLAPLNLALDDNVVGPGGANMSMSPRTSSRAAGNIDVMPTVGEESSGYVVGAPVACHSKATAHDSCNSVAWS